MKEVKEVNYGQIEPLVVLITQPINILWLKKSLFTKTRKKSNNYKKNKKNEAHHLTLAYLEPRTNS